MDPLADLVAWIALFGTVGLLLIGFAERFLPALPSHGVLVAIGIATSDDAWSLPAAIVGTALGSFTGALALYLIVRAFGEEKSVAAVHFLGKWVGLSRHRIDRTLSSLKARERTVALTSQLVPTIRLISPLAAGILGMSALRFASGLAAGIVLWNGLFIAAGYLAVMALPQINASAFALKILLFLIVVEGAIALMVRLQRGVTNRLRRGDHE